MQLIRGGNLNKKYVQLAAVATPFPSYSFCAGITKPVFIVNRCFFLFPFLLVCFFAVLLNSISFCTCITELAFTVKTCARALSSMWNPIRNSRQSIFWKQIVHRETFAAPKSGCFDFRRFSTQVVPNRFTALVSAKLRIISCSQIKTNGENRHWFVDFTNLGIKALIQRGRGSALPHVRAASRRTKRSLGTNKHVSWKCVAAEHCKCWGRCDSEQMQCFCKPSVVIL